MTATRIRLGLLVATVFALAAGCGAAEGAADPRPAAPVGGFVVVAAGMAFDRAEITVPADQAFPLLFENRDSAPHNVTVLGAAGQPIFVGEIFGGSGSRTYAMPALPAGRFSFRCDVHPDMVGTLNAVETPVPAAAPAPTRPAPDDNVGTAAVPR